MRLVFWLARTQVLASRRAAAEKALAAGQATNAETERGLLRTALMGAAIAQATREAGGGAGW